MTNNRVAKVVSITNAGYVPVSRVDLHSPIYINNIRVWSATTPRPEVPISSYGVIAFQRGSGGLLKYLVIRRCDSMGLVDLIRGKYCNKNIEEICKIYMEEMTEDERRMVATQSFEQLCSHIWLNRSSKSYKNELARSKAKWEALDIQGLLKQTKAKYSEPEWGIPKGRKNPGETLLECAVREFEEETCISPNDYAVYTEIKPLEEIYRATNGVLYKHLYYIAELKPGLKPEMSRTSERQREEVSAITLLPLAEALKKFRPYDISKKLVLTEADRIIRKETKGRMFSWIPATT